MSLSEAWVLIADGHQINRTVFRLVLEKEGYRVVDAATAAQALKEAPERDYAVILLDLHLPDMHGHEAGALLRTMERTARTPIIFTSARDWRALRDTRGYEPGATDYLFSPVDPELMRLKVNAYVALHERKMAMKARLDEARRLVNALHARVSTGSREPSVLAGLAAELQTALRSVSVA